jgi:hypothetical protein
MTFAPVGAQGGYAIPSLPMRVSATPLRALSIESNLVRAYVRCFVLSDETRCA